MDPEDLPSPQTQNAVNAYLWAIEEALKHDLTFENAVTLARLAFEAVLQLEMRLLNMMAILPQGTRQ